MTEECGLLTAEEPGTGWPRAPGAAGTAPSREADRRQDTASRWRMVSWHGGQTNAETHGDKDPAPARGTEDRQREVQSQRERP